MSSRSRSLLVALVSTGLVSTALVSIPEVSASAASTAVASPVGARAGATRIPFSINDEMQASVDVGTGNLMVTTADRSVPSINGMMSFGLAYESFASSSESQLPAGAAGTGWFLPMGQDTRLIAASDGSVLFQSTNGTQGKYTPIAGSSSYGAPAGFRQSLVKNADGTWLMTDAPSQTKIRFGTDGRLVSMTDRNAQVTSFAYSAGNLSSASLPTGQVVTFTFANGKLASMTRPANGALPAGTVTYGYDTAGRLESITRPALPGGAASVTRFTYTPAGDLASITDPMGNATQFTYDSTHRITSVAQGRGTDLAKTRFAYMSATQTKVASPISNQAVEPWQTYHTTYTIDTSKRVTAVDSPYHYARSRTYTPSFDVASASNGIGGTASATYGANGGPMTKATSAMGSSQSWTYGTGDNAWNPSTSTDSQGNQSLMTYSNIGMPASTTNGGGAKASVTYNADGTIATSTDPAGRQTTYTESASGKYIAKITPPAGSNMGPTIISGNPATSVTNGAGQTTTYTYNDRYALTQAKTATQAVSFTYDANGRVTSRADKNQRVTYGYDARGNVTSIAATPVAGGKAPAANTVTYTYDLAGNMTSRTVAGLKTTYAYDQANQLISMTGPTGALTMFAYNGTGQRTDTWWRTNSAKTSWIAHTKNVFGVGGNLTQTYTATNSNDANRVSDYSYCYAKYVSGQTCPSNTNSSANTGLIQYQTNNIAKMTAQFGYDKHNRLVSVANWAGHNYTYTYDTNGNRTRVTTDGVTTQSLTFTADNQLSAAGYAYDKAGRRTADPSGGSTTWNDLGQTATVTKGTDTGTTSYAGLGQNELIQQTRGTTAYGYVYGRDSQAGFPRNELVTNSVTTTPTLINHDASGQAIDFTEGTNSQYVIYSGIGNMIGTIGHKGSNVTTYHNDPWGALLSISSGPDGLSPQPKSGVAARDGKTSGIDGISGTSTSSGAGQQSPWGNFGIQGVISKHWKRGERWNDTYTGTWTSLDPITRLNDPARANPYVFEGDNPINYMDPVGKDWSDVTDFIGGLSACVSGGSVASGYFAGVGSLFGPEGTVIGGVAGFTYGCGAGVIANATLGFNPIQDFQKPFSQ